MSTDYQQARAALGTRLRELRITCPGGRLTGAELAVRLGWTQSKISKLENGRQTASSEDLRLWAVATGHPEVYEELEARLRGFESNVRSRRRQLASGHRPVQDTWDELVAGATTIHEWEPAMVSGMLQTADYARHVFLRYAELQNSVRDTEEAVRSRMQRQEWLYRPGKRLQEHRRSLTCLVATSALRGPGTRNFAGSVRTRSRRFVAQSAERPGAASSRARR